MLTSMPFLLLIRKNVEKWIRKGTYTQRVVGEDEKYRRMEQ
jgi:hypothetical protein